MPDVIDVVDAWDAPSTAAKSAEAAGWTESHALTAYKDVMCRLEPLQTAISRIVRSAQEALRAAREIKVILCVSTEAIRIWIPGWEQTVPPFAIRQVN